jgi:DNA-binding MarR family transcriptional regulator
MKHNAPHRDAPTHQDTPARGDLSSAAPEYSFSTQIGHLLRRAYQRHTALFQQTIPDSQLTAAQFVAMCAIREFQSCSLSEIVKATAIDQATIRGIIERLRTRELIKISHDAKDGRKVVVSLSPAGEALVDQTIPFAQIITEDTFGNLNPAERVAILYLLRKMCDLNPDET